MKVGSKVVCIARVADWFKREYPDHILPEYRHTYTVRDMRVIDGELYVGLVEIVNDANLLRDGVYLEPYWPVPEMIVFLEQSETTAEELIEELEQQPQTA